MTQGGPTEAPAPKSTTPPEKGGKAEIAETVPKHVRRVDSLTCYEVTDEELALLERGSPDSTLLNLAVAFIAAGISTLLTYVSATFKNDRVAFGFIAWTIAAFVAGAVMLVLWLVFRRSRSEVIARVRARGPE